MLPAHCPVFLQVVLPLCVTLASVFCLFVPTWCHAGKRSCKVDPYYSAQDGATSRLRIRLWCAGRVLAGLAPAAANRRPAPHAAVAAGLWGAP